MLTQLTSLQICHGKIWAVFLAGHLRQLCMLVLGARCSMTNPPEHRHHVIFWCPSKFMWMFEVLSNVCVFSKTGPILVYWTSTWKFWMLQWRCSDNGVLGEVLVPWLLHPRREHRQIDGGPPSCQSMMTWSRCQWIDDKPCLPGPSVAAASSHSPPQLRGPALHGMSCPHWKMRHSSHWNIMQTMNVSDVPYFQVSWHTSTQLWWFFILTTSARSRSQHPQQASSVYYQTDVWTVVCSSRRFLACLLLGTSEGWKFQYVSLSTWKRERDKASISSPCTLLFLAFDTLELHSNFSKDLWRNED